MSAKGLVERIGGTERLRAILAGFYARLVADPMIGFFFAGRDLDAITDGQHAFLMWAFGASPDLEVRHPRDAHGALPPILRGHFDRRLMILKETLLDEGLSRADIAAWLKIERSMRRHVEGPR